MSINLFSVIYYIGDRGSKVKFSEICLSQFITLPQKESPREIECVSRFSSYNLWVIYFLHLYIHYSDRYALCQYHMRSKLNTSFCMPLELNSSRGFPLLNFYRLLKLLEDCGVLVLGVILGPI